MKRSGGPSSPVLLGIARVARGVLILALLLTAFPPASTQLRGIIGADFRPPSLPSTIFDLRDRYAQSVRSLVSGERTLGYVSDTQDPGAFYQVQYAMAPHLLLFLDTAAAPPNVPRVQVGAVRYVLGAFPTPPSIRSLEEEHGIELFRELGPGLYLFRRKGL